jgi:CheY-like chemotaxis protein
MFNIGQEPTTLLLIDDDLVSREVMATVLTMSGYAVHTAENGATSIALLETKEFTPDAILMDAQMPGLSGTELINALRAHSRARVFAISGSSAPNEVVAAADGFLQKPLGVDALRRALREPLVAIDQAAWTRKPVAEPMDDEPVLSAATLEQLREMMTEAAVKEIYTTVVADLTARQVALEAAMATGDKALVRRIGHAIKGSCGMAGAMQAAKLGTRLEALPADFRVDQQGECAAILRALGAATGSLKRMLEAEFPIQ